LTTALARLRKALETEDIDTIDATLYAVQSLPSEPGTRKEISRIAELILIADFKQAKEAVEALR
jgi:hypothetical protein